MSRKDPYFWHIYPTSTHLFLQIASSEVFSAASLTNKNTKQRHKKANKTNKQKNPTETNKRQQHQNTPPPPKKKKNKKQAPLQKKQQTPPGPSTKPARSFFPVERWLLSHGKMEFASRRPECSVQRHLFNIYFFFWCFLNIFLGRLRRYILYIFEFLGNIGVFCGVFWRCFGDRDPG